MKKYFILFYLILSFLGKSQGIIEITNPANYNRLDEVVSIPWKEISSACSDIDISDFIVINTLNKQQVPYQLEYCGEFKVQNLLIQISVEANAVLVLKIIKGKPHKVAAKTYCRYVPERKDDFAWENDKIAFRAYGKALENTTEDAYGFDVWVKKTDRLVIEERYIKGDYHTDHGDGLDYYHVGFSLGAGNIAPFRDDSIWYSKNYHYWKILDNGPLRSTFQLEYDEWNVGSEKVKVVKTITIDAGEQLHKIEARFSFSESRVLPVVVGIIKREQAGFELFDEQNGIMGYWEPRDTLNGTTGVGCVFMQPVKNVLIRKGQLLSLLDVYSGTPVIYYRGAAWDKAGRITSAKDWFGYLQEYQQKLKSPMKVAVHKSS